MINPTLDRPGITIDCDGVPIRYKSFLFSGGEVQVKILDPIPQGDSPILIRAFLRSAQDIIELIMISDALSYISERERYLECPYFPYARQDRVCARGEAFGAKVAARMLEPYFSSFTFWDIHSAVSMDLFKGACRVKNIEASCFISPFIEENELVIAPDKGALNRARDSAGPTNPVLTMSKVRNPDNGQITSIALLDKMPENYQGAPAIIVDDICDGGRTFVGAGKALREVLTGPLRLYVTHGIFSNGFNELLEVFDEVLVANLMYPGDTIPDRVKVIDIKP